MPPRKRWAGTHHGLAEVILPYVDHVSWLRYAEKGNSPVAPAVLIAKKELIRNLTELSSNLSFRKPIVKSAFHEIAEAKRFQELQEEADLEDWVETMTARLKVLCRHVAHSRVRPTPPAWLQEIDGPGHQEMSSDDAGGHAGEGGHGHAAAGGGGHGGEGHHGAGDDHGHEGGAGPSSAADDGDAED